MGSTKVPANWKLVQLRRVMTIRNGTDHKDVQLSDGDYPVYGSGGPFTRASGFLYEGESVLFGRKGTIDRPRYVTGRFWTIDTMFYTELSDSIVGRFLYYFATTIPYSYYSTATALPSMTQGDLAGHPILLPPLDEQRAIADYLDEQTSRIDTLIAKQNQFIDTLRERRTGEIVRGVTGWTPAMRDPESWTDLASMVYPTAPLRHMGLLATGTTPSGEHDELFGDDEGGMGWVTPEDLASSVRASRWLRKAGEAQVRRLLPGAVLVCCIGATLGKVGFSKEPISTNQQITGITAHDDGRYLYYGLLAAREELKRLAVGNTLPILNNQRLASLVLPSPPLEKQREIADYLDTQTFKIDALIAKTQEHIALAKERRSALITAAVTGQFDVRTAAQKGAA